MAFTSQKQIVLDMIKAACYDDLDLIKCNKNPDELRIRFHELFRRKSLILDIRYKEILLDSGEEVYNVESQLFYRIYHSVILHKGVLVLKVYHKHYNPITLLEYENGIDSIYKNVEFVDAKYLNLAEFLRLYQSNILDLIKLFGMELIYQTLDYHLNCM